MKTTIFIISTLLSASAFAQEPRDFDWTEDAAKGITIGASAASATQAGVAIHSAVNEEIQYRSMMDARKTIRGLRKEAEGIQKWRDAYIKVKVEAQAERIEGIERMRESLRAEIHDAEKELKASEERLAALQGQNAKKGIVTAEEQRERTRVEKGRQAITELYRKHSSLRDDFESLPKLEKDLAASQAEAWKTWISQNPGDQDRLAKIGYLATPESHGFTDRNVESRDYSTKLGKAHFQLSLDTKRYEKLRIGTNARFLGTGLSALVAAGAGYKWFTQDEAEVNTSFGKKLAPASAPAGTGTPETDLSHTGE